MCCVGGGLPHGRYGKIKAMINKSYWFITCDVSRLGIGDGVVCRDSFGHRSVSLVGIRA
jgi:hypothetical protein